MSMRLMFILLIGLTILGPGVAKAGLAPCQPNAVGSHKAGLGSDFILVNNTSTAITLISVDGNGQRTESGIILWTGDRSETIKSDTESLWIVHDVPNNKCLYHLRPEMATDMTGTVETIDVR